MHQFEPIPSFDRDFKRERSNQNKTTAYHEVELLESAQSSHHQHQWLPYTLTTQALVLLLLVCSGLIGGVVTVWILNQRLDGFDVVSSNHYLWTYGPTAVLTLLVSVWRQVDYHTKSLLPWRELSRGDMPASKSVLLDYISPFHIVALWQAIMNGHFAVTVSTLTFVLLKLVTVASTGLLVSMPTTITKPNIPILIQSTFGSQNVMHNGVAYASEYDVSQYYMAYGILGKGLPQRSNTNEWLAFDEFSIMDYHEPFVSYRFNTTAFIPKFECQAVSLDIELRPLNATGNAYDQVRLQVPDCLVDDAQLRVLDISLNPKSELVPPRQLSTYDSTVRLINCSNNELDHRGPLRKVFSLFDLRYTQAINASDGLDVSASSWSRSLATSSSVICAADYRLETIEVTKRDGSTALQNINVTTFNPHLDQKLEGLTGSDLIWLNDGLLRDSTKIFGDPDTLRLDLDKSSTIFNIIMAAANSTTYDALLNQTTMARAAERALEQITIQIADTLLRTDTHRVAIGEATFILQRLHTSPISTWFMISGFVAIIFAIVIMMAVRPSHSMPDNFWKLSRAAILAKRSQRTLSKLPPCRSGSDKCNLDAITSYRFSISNGFNDKSDTRIALLAKADSIELSNRQDSETVSWWTQLTFRPETLVLTICLPVVVIVILEMLQRLSDRNSGFANIDGSSGLGVDLATRYLPALVMLSMGALYNCLDFNVLLLSPFRRMRNNAISASQLSESPYLGKMPIHTVWKALFCREWLIVVSSFAAFTGTFLTIVVSGLFTVIEVPKNSTVLVSRTDQWNTTWADAAFTDRGAAVLLSLIESSNLSYPPMTFGEIAFPQVSVNLSCSDNTSCKEELIEIEMPGVRANLECTDIPSSMIASDFADSKYYWSLEQEFNYTLPKNCQFGGQHGNESQLSLAHTVDIGNSLDTVVFGKIRDVHVGPYGDYELSLGEGQILTQPDNPPGCPSLILHYGFLNRNNSAENHVTTMVCYQYVEKVTANVMLQAPDLTISTLRPPVVNESSTRRTAVPRSATGQTAFQYRIQPHLQDSLAILNNPVSNRSGDTITVLDSFFQGVLYGQQNISDEYFKSERFQPRVLEAIQHLYRLYMAQAISNNMRTPINDSSAVPSAGTCGTACIVASHKANRSVHENLYLPVGAAQMPFSKDIPLIFQGRHVNATTEYRIVQHKTSKLVLQGLLSFMVICGVIIVSCFSFRELVVGNPCTIWGMLALWRGSRFCSDNNQIPTASLTSASPLLSQHANYERSTSLDRHRPNYMPDGVEFWKTTAIVGIDGPWGNMRFKMGWWTDDETGARRYGIDAIPGAGNGK